MLCHPSGGLGTFGGGGAGGANADEGGRLSFTTVMTMAGAAVSVLVGSYLTALAVVDGDTTATFVRFVLSVALGVYYVFLFHLSRGRRFFSS